MAELQDRIASALLKELIAQGQFDPGVGAASALTAYPVSGHLDIVALARSVEQATADDSSEDGVPPSRLNANNDG